MLSGAWQVTASQRVSSVMHVPGECRRAFVVRCDRAGHAHAGHPFASARPVPGRDEVTGAGGRPLCALPSLRVQRRVRPDLVESLRVSSRPMVGEWKATVARPTPKTALQVPKVATAGPFYAGRVASVLLPRELRLFVLARDNFCCWICGCPGALQCDHVVPATDDPRRRYDASNLRAVHGAGRRNNPCPQCSPAMGRPAYCNGLRGGDDRTAGEADHGRADRGGGAADS
jgi:5-methylcytosine-specific restriction endonuclease McrA